MHGAVINFQDWCNGTKTRNRQYVVMVVFGKSFIFACPTTSATYWSEWLRLKWTLKHSCYICVIEVDMELRINIKFCFRLRKTNIQHSEMLKQVYREETLSLSHTSEWFSLFRGRLLMCRRWRHRWLAKFCVHTRRNWQSSWAWYFGNCISLF